MLRQAAMKPTRPSYSAGSGYGCLAIAPNEILHLYLFVVYLMMLSVAQNIASNIRMINE
jgi:hypothetical protein